MTRLLFVVVWLCSATAALAEWHSSASTDHFTKVATVRAFSGSTREFVAMTCDRPDRLSFIYQPAMLLPQAAATLDSRVVSVLLVVDDGQVIEQPIPPSARRSMGRTMIGFIGDAVADWLWLVASAKHAVHFAVKIDERVGNTASFDVHGATDSALSVLRACGRHGG